MNYTIYRPDTGEILQNISCNDHELLALNIGSQTYIEGWYDPSSYYIADNKPIQKSAAPWSLWLTYYWDIQHKDWKIHPDLSATKCRQYRNGLLADVDRVNPVWYASLTESQQAELQVYRQALLDVPQQPGFPGSVDWPQQPTWFNPAR